MLISRIVEENKLIVARKLNGEKVLDALIREATKSYVDVKLVKESHLGEYAIVVQCTAQKSGDTVGLYIQLEEMLDGEEVTAICSMSEVERIAKEVEEFLEPMLRLI